MISTGISAAHFTFSCAGSIRAQPQNGVHFQAAEPRVCGTSQRHFRRMNAEPDFSALDRQFGDFLQRLAATHPPPKCGSRRCARAARARRATSAFRSRRSRPARAPQRRDAAEKTARQRRGRCAGRFHAAHSRCARSALSASLLGIRAATRAGDPSVAPSTAHGSFDRESRTICKRSPRPKRSRTAFTVITGGPGHGQNADGDEHSRAAPGAAGR